MGDFILIYFAIFILVWAAAQATLLPVEPSKRERLAIVLGAMVWPIPITIWIVYKLRHLNS